MLFYPSEARRLYRVLARHLKRTPTVREFAESLGVSTRTAWRYMKDSRSCVREKCAHCEGTGYVTK
jgi:predicted DNA-binding transcriptional regulator YafY